MLLWIYRASSQWERHSSVSLHSTHTPIGRGNESVCQQNPDSSRSYRWACIAHGCLFSIAVLLMKKWQSWWSKLLLRGTFWGLSFVPQCENAFWSILFIIYLQFVLPYYRSAKSSRFCLDVCNPPRSFPNGDVWVLGNCTGVKILCCVHLYDRLQEVSVGLGDARWSWSEFFLSSLSVVEASLGFTCPFSNHSSFSFVHKLSSSDLWMRACAGRRVCLSWALSVI